MFSNSVFNVDGNLLTVTTQVFKFTMQKKVLLTCTLVQNNQVSVFHNQLATVKDDQFIPEHRFLPSLPIDPLKQQRSNVPRKHTKEELLGGNVLILYSKDKMAIQCLTPQQITFDNNPISCLNDTLEWFPTPSVIRDGTTQDILFGHTNFRSKIIT